jgi:cytosine/adenosine deaminase-related metal-dependent hydrolase
VVGSTHPPRLRADRRPGPAVARDATLGIDGGPTSALGETAELLGGILPAGGQRARDCSGLGVTPGFVEPRPLVRDAVAGGLPEPIDTRHLGLHWGKPFTPTPARPTKRMAMIDGARALGWDRDIGSLKTGKKANLMLFDLRSFEWVPYGDPLNALVWSVSPASIAQTESTAGRSTGGGPSRSTSTSSTPKHTRARRRSCAAPAAPATTRR